MLIISLINYQFSTIYIYFNFFSAKGKNNHFTMCACLSDCQVAHLLSTEAGCAQCEFAVFANNHKPPCVRWNHFLLSCHMPGASSTETDFKIKVNQTKMRNFSIYCMVSYPWYTGIHLLNYLKWINFIVCYRNHLFSGFVSHDDIVCMISCFPTTHLPTSIVCYCIHRMLLCSTCCKATLCYSNLILFYVSLTF